jgi:2'-5' RNA ligase
MPETERSGLAVPIAIPTALAGLRDRYDRAAAQGAQPHVTVLFPFVPCAGLDDTVRGRLRAIAAGVGPFEVTFRRVRRFDDGVVWIEPEPSEPFHRLTAAVAAAWPDHPPYEGRFDEVIAHLTVVEADAGTAPLEAIEAEAAALLPFTSRADRLELWCQDAAGRWRPRWRLPLGQGAVQAT